MIVGTGNSEAFVQEFVTALGEHRFPQSEGARGGIAWKRRR